MAGLRRWHSGAGTQAAADKGKRCDQCGGRGAHVAAGTSRGVAFYVSASGETFVSGNIIMQQAEPSDESIEAKNNS